MNQSFYIGANGAYMQQKRMNIQGDNIANVNTYGYKASSGRFAELMFRNMLGINNAQLPAGVGTKITMTSTDFRSGGVADTGREQDYMIDGDGFFALVDLRTQEISFTRNGSFTVGERVRDSGEVDEEGNPILETVMGLTDGNGRFVLSDQGTLIEVTDIHAEQPVGVFDFANYDGIQHISGTRYLPVEKNGGLMFATGKPIRGVLETSNVDLAEEFTKVIESQRAYGIALKMVQTSDEIETTINGLRN